MRTNGSNIRNVRADQTRIHIFRKGLNILNVFSSKEFKIVINFFKSRITWVICLVVLTLFLSFLEGVKTLSLLGFVRISFVSPAELKQFLNFKVLDWQINLGNYLGSEKGNVLFSIFMIFVIFSFLASLTKYFNNILTTKLRLSLVRDVRRRLYDKIMLFDMGFFDEAKTGDLIFMINAEASRFSNMMLYLRNLALSFFNLLICLGLLFFIFPRITLIPLVSIWIFLLLHLRVDRRLKVAAWESNMRQNFLYHIFQQILYGIKLIKLAGVEKREEDNYLKYHKEFERYDLATTRIRSLSHFMREVFFIFLIGGMVFSFIRFGNRFSDSGTILAYLLVLVRTLPFFSEFQSGVLSVVETYAPMSRIANILGKPVPVRQQAKTSRKAIDRIETIKLVNAVFSYNEKKILDNLSVDFKKGELTAIVGLSGIGKSTLLDVISGIREASAGKIFFNNVPSHELDEKFLKEKIGYVGQEPLVFYDTVKENITFFKRNASEDEIERVLQMSALKEFISNLPQGLDTGLGERGLTISGGERQRIGLARVLLKNPEVLLLDECTNSLDLTTESIIYDNIKNTSRDRIVIVVAHRFSTINGFDRILVLHNGKFIEEGTHDELMQKKGLYYSLYMIQEAK